MVITDLTNKENNSNMAFLEFDFTNDGGFLLSITCLSRKRDWEGKLDPPVCHGIGRGWGATGRGTPPPMGREWGVGGSR
ncbi:hypothetical protein R6Q59_018914 [Mikania micrantha]